ncbi:uncharacterized protein LOC129751473 [Uranotaenia lowii]|uniref:uncharacterized protein LOC129751473 n=1 Tax=Uranotaenia lowii TaxID=190385 RepID=UPI00247ADE36|nr:uncharacterized protein LOC129751473 [Uranotaenia lowii]
MKDPTVILISKSRQRHEKMLSALCLYLVRRGLEYSGFPPEVPSSKISVVQAFPVNIVRDGGSRNADKKTRSDHSIETCMFKENLSPPHGKLMSSGVLKQNSEV